MTSCQLTCLPDWMTNDIFGGFDSSWGYPNSWMVFVRENPNLKLGRFGGTPISGKPPYVNYIDLLELSSTHVISIIMPIPDAPWCWRIEYVPTFTSKNGPNVGKYSSTMEHHAFLSVPKFAGQVFGGELGGPKVCKHITAATWMPRTEKSRKSHGDRHGAVWNQHWS